MIYSCWRYPLLRGILWVVPLFSFSYKIEVQGALPCAGLGTSLISVRSFGGYTSESQKKWNEEISKLQREWQNFREGLESPTAQELQQIQLVNAAFKESLRLENPMPLYFAYREIALEPQTKYDIHVPRRIFRFYRAITRAFGLHEFEFLKALKVEPDSLDFSEANVRWFQLMGVPKFNNYIDFMEHFFSDVMQNALASKYPSIRHELMFSKLIQIYETEYEYSGPNATSEFVVFFSFEYGRYWLRAESMDSHIPRNKDVPVAYIQNPLRPQISIATNVQELKRRWKIFWEAASKQWKPSALVPKAMPVAFEARDRDRDREEFRDYFDVPNDAGSFHDLSSRGASTNYAEFRIGGWPYRFSVDAFLGFSGIKANHEDQRARWDRYKETEDMLKQKFEVLRLYFQHFIEGRYSQVERSLAADYLRFINKMFEAGYYVLPTMGEDIGQLFSQGVQIRPVKEGPKDYHTHGTHFHPATASPFLMDRNWQSQWFDLDPNARKIYLKDFPRSILVNTLASRIKAELDTSRLRSGSTHGLRYSGLEFKLVWRSLPVDVQSAALNQLKENIPDIESRWANHVRIRE